MRELPERDPGTPDTRSAARYLLWLARVQLPTMAAGVLFGVVWMVSQALMPAAIGKAIDQGVTGRDTGALVTWTLVLLGLGVVQAAAGTMRHRIAVTNWLSAAFRTVQIVVRHAVRLGATLPRRVAAGEVVSIGATDIEHVGSAMEITARAAGAVAACVTVAVLLLNMSTSLGLAVLIGVPALVLAVGPLLRPLHRRQAAYRMLVGDLTTLGSDIVSGLRVLRGIGGEEVFADRYRGESQRVRAAGVRVARVESLLDAAQILLPGVFIVLVTWLGARLAMSGAISPGDLVASYGYAAFLLIPLSSATEAVHKITRGLVAARRVVRLLNVAPEIVSPAAPAAASAAGDLVDPESGLVVPSGRFTAVAAAAPEDAAVLADRLGRYTDSEVTWGGVPLAALPLAEVRRAILVSDADARLFSGRLRDELTGGRDLGVAEALRVASAEDVVATLPDGLGSEMAERGRSLSGGQRQRLLLARALLADPRVLVLVEPTSAVDAHTEARVAAGLARARTDRTTVVFTTSPLVLDRAERVAYVEDSKVVATGTHRDLLDSEPRYRATVTREEAP